MTEYKHPEVLVSTEWVAAHVDDPMVRLVEVGLDTSSYEKGHIKNAMGWSWTTQLNDPLRRDIPSQKQFEELCNASGIANDHTVVLYGDNDNWFAAYAFWQFKVYAHRDVRLMNGGREKWETEGRPFTTEGTAITRTTYHPGIPDSSLRARRDNIFQILSGKPVNLVDVRSPDEFSGKIIAPPGMTETAQRGGHIPGATNIPWSEAVNGDGTFKAYDELVALYEAQGVRPDKDAVTYCRMGERSAHAWFVLKYLLGFEKVRNYDGSWTEWGNLMEAPIEKGEAEAASGV
jgi:thiosulfate/3-mercaptopyruvate sulfurtransferase